MSHDFEEESQEAFKKRKETIENAIKGAATKSDSEILKSASKEMSMQTKEEVKHNSELARTLFNEGMDLYESGEMSFKEFIDDLHESLSVSSKRIN